MQELKIGVVAGLMKGPSWKRQKCRYINEIQVKSTLTDT